MKLFHFKKSVGLFNMSKTAVPSDCINEGTITDP